MDRARHFAGRHVVFAVNADWFFESHRLPLALALLEAGADVSLVTAATGRETALARLGIRVEAIPLSRSGRDPREMASLVRRFRGVFRMLRPSLVHNVTVKPVLAASFAAKSFDRRLPVVNAISGFGHLLSDAEAGRAAALAASVAYRMALRAPSLTRVIVQNDAAAEWLCRNHVARCADVRLIPGMGVDIRRFAPPSDRDRSSPIVMLASRMIRSKGVLEFAEAASLLRDRFPEARFVLVGAPDPGNPLSLDAPELRAIAEKFGVEWWGEAEDMSAVLRRAHVFVLPTYHEGLPKVLLEAAATGLPIVSSDIAGCRQVVRNRLEGLLVRPRDPRAIADSIGELLDEPETAMALGRAARARVSTAFTIDHAVDAHLRLYAELLSEAGS